MIGKEDDGCRDEVTARGSPDPAHYSRHLFFMANHLYSVFVLKQTLLFIRKCQFIYKTD